MHLRSPLSLLALVCLAALVALAPAAVGAASTADAPHAGHPNAHAPALQDEHPPIEDEVADEPADDVDLADDAEGEEEEGEDGEKEDEKWDVSAPPGPSSEIAIDVTTGTWMSLDVSPDGQTVVFDLLGDLYTLPIAGGEATALTSGVAWDMQPTFSPDGRSIAFTSDQGGGDNIWILDLDEERGESNPHAVTEESFRLLNSPAWSPDGEFVVAKKHFTASRSLGSGEIWLYHTSGGGGVQLTEKPNDQKDVGEPVFSADGDTVYFSQDTTPGPIFQYNKDPNPGIYSIKRLELETGDIETYISGPGGAIRPTPSSQGDKLAFVRRIRGKTVLHVKDLASGEEYPVWDGLERDMQETWAIHGVYPTMEWMPDGREIVLWAGGKLHRVNVETRAVAEIPFHVSDTRTVFAAVRSPIEVAPDEVAVQMVRWPEVSPDGGRVVFQALGKIWIKDLPDGAPRRVTTQTDHFEFYPSWSRDGRSIVYVGWDDRALGSVRVAPAAGGPGRVLTPHPGHYIEPVMSPDGKTVVYSKAEGGYLRTPLYSADPGIYRVPVAGGVPEEVTDDGGDPHFGAASDRVYVTRRDDGKSLLVAIGLDGSDERTVATSENATRFRVSPDGRWIAWQERFDAHVIPLPRTGKALSLAPKGKDLPTATVSRDAGNYLHWSGDSAALHWSTGPELFTRRLPEAFAFLDGAPEELPEPPTEGIQIGFSVPAPKPAGTTALVGGRIITMNGEEVIEDGTIVVTGDRIAAVGPRSEIAVPAGARTIDTTGKTLIPGLIDVHWHGGHGSEEIEPEQNWNYFAALAFGVTTAHDPSADTSTVFSSSEMARAGLITAPRIFSTGTILYGAEVPIRAIIDSYDDALSHLRRMKAQGAFSVKSYNQPRREQRQQVLAAARELGMLVVPEGGSLFQHNMTMIVDGHTGIEHSIPVAAIYDDVRQLWRATEVGYTPTLVVGYGGLWGEEYWYATTNVWENERLLTFVPRELVDPRSRRRAIAPPEEWNHFNNSRVAAELRDEGVKVLLGAHGQREGLAAHWELWMFEQGGMTPHQALRAATLDGAWYLGMDHDLGSLEPGKLADIAVLAENPLDNLQSSAGVDLVMVGGRLYDAATMNQLAPEAKEREPFYFERDATTGRLVLAPEE